MDWLLGAKKHSGAKWERAMREAPDARDMQPSSALAQAQSIPLATDGLSDPTIPASVPKWNLILPQNPVTALGSSVEQQLDFNIQCQDVGKIQNLLVNFNYSTAAGKTPIIVPTPYFVNRVDFFAPDGSTLETLYNDQLWVESCTLLTDQAVATVAPLFNFKVNATAPFISFNSATVASTTYNHWLSLNGSFLAACQPYLKGCGSGYFKIRLYLATNLSTDGSANTQGTLTANYVNLWVQEAVLSANAEEALKRAHHTGIQYSSVVRNMYSLTMAAQAVSTTFTLQLQGFFAESAGLYVMFKPSNSNADSITRSPIASMYLQDSQGRQLTQNMSAELMEAIVAPSVVAVSSYFINTSTQTTYLFPFSTNLQRVIEGKSLGSYQLTGNERFVGTTTSSGALALGSLFNAISWDYSKLVVVNNSPRQFVLGSNS